MKGVRFYVDIDGTQNDEGVSFVPKRITVRELRKWAEPGDSFTPVNCLAVFTDNRSMDGSFKALGALMLFQDSPVCSTSVSGKYLAQNCRRVPEEVALRLHPQLAKRLNME